MSLGVPGISLESFFTPHRKENIIYPRHPVIPPQVWCMQVCFGGPKTFSGGVWMSRVTYPRHPNTW